ncbi:MAG: glutathione S-transferase family protein [Burkholderiales bacterium]
MAMLQLYTARNSICTQKVFITLHEKQLDWDQKIIDLFKNEQYNAEYLKINPKGVVPSLVHDGAAVVESTLICEYLDEVFPTPALRPADALGRARMRLWSKFIDEGIFEATREISFSAMFRERMKNMTEEQRQTRFRNVGDPERRMRYISTYEEGVESIYVFQGIAAYEKLFKAMDAQLATGAPWMCGAELSLGDINLMPFVARLEYLDLLSVWTAERPRVLEWWARAKARDSFVKAIASQLTSDEIDAMKSHGGKIRDRIAERRAEYLAS